MSRARQIIEQLSKRKMELTEAAYKARIDRANQIGTLDNTFTPTNKLPALRILENAEVKEGIYYALPMPNGTWQLYTHIFSEWGEGPNTTHGDVWESFLAHLLSVKWEPHVTIDADELEQRIKLLAYAIPRGRVSLAMGSLRGKIIVNHGGDLPSSISPSSVERSFGIQGRAQWEIDDHERRDPEEILELRDILSEQYVNPKNPGRFPSLKAGAPAPTAAKPAAPAPAKPVVKKPAPAAKPAPARKAAPAPVASRR